MIAKHPPRGAQTDPGAFHAHWTLDREPHPLARASRTQRGPRQAPSFMKGNEAVIHGALLAGCRCFFGYPITPASEIAHTAAELFPRVGGVFLQAESEIAAIQMVYGAASSGVRTMTASSSPGISLKQEGISYAAGSELPMVVVDITRGGPGLGNIAPEQGDYFQMVKGGGHGNYRMPVLAPSGAQEMCDLTMDAFGIADHYRTPVIVLTDGLVGQMKEPVELPPAVPALPPKPWAVRGDARTRKNLISSIYLDPPALEAHIRHLQEKYAAIEEHECRWEVEGDPEPDLLVVSYGVVSRIVRGALAEARAKGLRVGTLRPITLWPFPTDAIARLASTAKAVLTVELSTGQMVEDVRLAVNGRVPVHFLGRAGGVLPTNAELVAEMEACLASEEVAS